VVLGDDDDDDCDRGNLRPTARRGRSQCISSQQLPLHVTSRQLCNFLTAALFDPSKMANPANPLSLSPEALKKAVDALPEITMTGGCHCGAVRYKVLHPALGPQETCQVPVTSCNCSICEKNGYFSIYPKKEKIEWLSGWDEMKNYQFRNKDRDHKFCGTCGSSIGIDFQGKASDTMALNVSFLRVHRNVSLIRLQVRMIDDIDLDSLYIKKWDGKSKI